MKCGILDLRNITEEQLEKMVEFVMNYTLEGEMCSICNETFTTHKEKIETVVSGTNPLTYAHGHCWAERKI